MSCFPIANYSLKPTRFLSNSLISKVLFPYKRYINNLDNKKQTLKVCFLLLMAGTTRLELATSCVTGMRSNQLSYAPIFNCHHNLLIRLPI